MSEIQANIESEAALGMVMTTAPLQFISDVGELVKARLSCLVLITVAVGFQLGVGATFDYGLFLLTLLGALLGAFGANGLNQWWELSYDRQMARTCDRPLPSGRMRPETALVITGTFLVAGTALLVYCHPVAAVINLAVALGYLFVYTPMKRRTAWSLLPGAIVGAAPPLIGWVAAHGSLGAGGWSLFGIIFAWQLPHFLAIDWMHRDDYSRAGYRMVSRADPSGALTGTLSIVFTVVLIAVSLLPLLAGLGDGTYAVVALALGAGMLALSVLMRVRRSTGSARVLFLASLAYLPLLLGALVLVRP
jgi:protoheme IX farnesyltransferase